MKQELYNEFLYEYYDAVHQIARDPELRERMQTSPSGVLREQGVDILPGMELQVVESSADVRYFVLPPDPNAGLAEANLDAVAGGTGTAQCAQSAGLMSASSLW